jgi:hypothetical protein|tara:strand:- start:522 stop:1316 length:795 start_codon:yes stop_codon:yes gene_type:complete
MKLRIDYHLHPNLPKDEEKAIKKCDAYWKKLEEQNIHYLIVTEHVYKNPKRAFECMQKTKPKGMHCYPGVEYLTKEGIDIILFAKEPIIYTYTQLEPYKMSLKQTMAFVKEKKLFSFVTHPYTLGTTSIVRIAGRKSYQEAVNTLGAVEISNGSPANLGKLLTWFPLNLLTKGIRKEINKNLSIPKEDYPKKTKFLAAGSDAHEVWQIGDCLELETEEKDPFKNITNNRKVKIINKKASANLLDLLITGWICFKEWRMKKKLNE